MSAEESLSEMIAVCRGLGVPRFAQEVATVATAAVDKEIKRTASAGTTPDGQPWEPRKADGERALANVASQLTTKAYGQNVKVTLRGPAVFHNYGAGAPVRQVIPDRADKLPEGLQRAITDAAGEVFSRALAGKGVTP